MPNSFQGNWKWQLHHNGFGLITISSFILLIMFSVILGFIDGAHISSCEIDAPYIYICICMYLGIYICIYIYIYMPVKGNTRISLKQSTFYEVEISTSLVGLEPMISRLHTKFHYSSCLRSSKQGISNIFLYIKVCKQRNCIRKLQKMWIEYVRWRPFWILRFVGKRCHLQLGIWQKWIQHKIAYKSNKWSIFLKNAYRSLSRAIFQFFVLTITD